MSGGGEGASRPGRETALAALFFLAVTILMTWPQAVRLGDAMTDIWDAKLNARILQWDYHQTLHDPAHLFDLNFFHPARDVLAFSENLWGVALFGWPLLALGASPLVNYNVLLLLGMFLSALSAWALARYVTGDPLAAIMAGLIYAFVPWRLSQLSHLQHQWGGFLCLLLLFLLRYLDGGRRADLGLFAVTFAWNALSNVHYLLFSGFLVALVLGFCVIEKGRAAAARVLAAAAAAAAGGLAFLPFALAYRRAEQLYGMRRYFAEMLQFSGKWIYFLSAGVPNRFWGPITRAWRGPEGDFFPGLVPLGFAAVALVAVRRSPGGSVASPKRRVAALALDALVALSAVLWMVSISHPGLRLGRLALRDPNRIIVCLTAFVVARLVAAFPEWSAYTDAGDWLRRSRVPPRLALFGAVGIVGVVIALGGHTPYYRFLFQTFGTVFGAIRSPARAVVLFDLALSVLAAWGVAVLLRSRSAPARYAWAALVTLAIVIEYRAFPLRLYPADAAAPPVYAWLAKIEAPGAVAEVPLGLEYEFDHVFRQAQHGRDLLNGYSGFFPGPYLELEAIFKRRPIPEAVWERVERIGARLVVYHAHERRGIAVAAYANALDLAVGAGRLDVLAHFPHDDGLDFVLATAGARVGGDMSAVADVPMARRLFGETVERLRAEGMRVSPPFGFLDAPGEGQTVAPGDWAFGWTLDDSGIAEVRAETEAGPVPVAAHLPRPGLEGLYPDYVEADRGGYAFRIPDLLPGTHRLRVTFVARDGGTTSVERMFEIARRRAHAAEPAIGEPKR